MSKPFDATLKAMVEEGPADWLRLAGLPDPPPATLIDADLSTVTAATDKVIRVAEARGGADFWLAHVEAMTYREGGLLARLRRDNHLLTVRHGCRVSTVLVLLRDGADVRSFDGTLREADPLTGREQVFQYTPLRVWEMSAAALLAGPLATLPLAAVADAPDDEVPAVVSAIHARFTADVTPVKKAEGMVATYTLLGMRHDESFVERLMQDIEGLEEISSFPQIFIRRGRLRQAREYVLALGARKFGEPDTATRAAVEAVVDLDRLDQLHQSILTAGSWAELLAEPPPHPAT